LDDAEGTARFEICGKEVPCPPSDVRFCIVEHGSGRESGGIGAINGSPHLVRRARAGLPQIVQYDAGIGTR